MARGVQHRVALVRIGILVCLVLVAATGCGAQEPAATDATTMTTPSSTLTPATSAPSTSTTAGTSATTTTIPRSTTTIAALGPFSAVGDVDGLPPAEASDTIPWDGVGKGWVAIDYQQSHDDQAVAGIVDAVYLVSPDGSLYTVGIIGTDRAMVLLDWDPVSHRFLFGADQPIRLIAVDMPSGAERVVPTGDAPTWQARFASNDGDVAYLDEAGVLHVVDPSGIETAVIDTGLAEYWDADEAVPSDPVPGFVASVEAERLVVGERGGIVIRDLDGTVVARHDPPGRRCFLTSVHEDHVVASCVDDPYWEACGMYWGDQHGGVWRIPLDGSPITAIYAPALPSGFVPSDESCWLPSFSDASDPDPDGNVLLEKTGCCECGGGLAVLADGATTDSDEDLWCHPGVVTRSTDGWFVLDWINVDGSWFGALLEVGGDGSLIRFITPDDIEYGGVWQAAG